jgi:hypothetical protein
MTDTTTLNRIIQSERIVGLLRGSHLPPPVYPWVVWGLTIGSGVGTSISIPRVDDVETNSGNKAEGDEFALVETTTDRATMTFGYVGHADEVTDEASYDAQEGAMALVTEKGVRALMHRVDADVHTLGATAATTTDLTDEAMTEEGFIDMQTDYAANQPHEGPSAAVFGPFQIRDLKISLKNNGNSMWGSDAGSMAVRELLKIQTAGYQGELHGTPVYRAGNVVTALGNHTGYMAKTGVGGALAYGVKERAGIEYDRKPRSKLWEVTIAARYGLTISDPLNIHGIRSRSAA